MEKFTAERTRAFTLIEVCVVLLICGIIIATAASLYRIYLKDSYNKNDQRRLDVITRSIESFYLKHGRLPCAANPSLPSSSTNFGVEVDCGGAIAPANIIEYTSTRTPPPPPQTLATSPAYSLAPLYQFGTVSPSSATPDQKVWVGAVPVRSLGLDDEFIANPSQFLYLYAITRNMAARIPDPPPPPLTVIDDIVDTTGGVIDIRHPRTGLSLLGTPHTSIYALISPGKRGNGAWVVNGPRRACTGAPTDDEYHNFCTNQSGVGDRVWFYGGSDSFVGAN